MSRFTASLGIGLGSAAAVIALVVMTRGSESSTATNNSTAVAVAADSSAERSRLSDAIRSRRTYGEVHPEPEVSPSVEIGHTISIVPNSSVVPGQLISGKDLDQGKLREVNLPRGQATISVDLPIEGGSVQTNRELSQWTRASADTAIREIFNAAPLQTTCLRVRHFAEYAHNQRRAEHLVNACGSVLGGLFEGDFATESAYYEEGTVFVAIFEQINYTASCHSLQRATDFFADSVTAQDFEDQFSVDDCPCYISDVHYGRYFAIAIHSSATRSSDVQEIRAGLNLIIAAASAKVTDRQWQLIDKCVVRSVALGGPQQSAIRAMTGREIEQYLIDGAKGGADAPAVPIACTVKNLRDNSVVQIARAWKAPTPPRRVRVTITGFKLLRAHDGDDEEDIDVYIGVNGHDLYVKSNINHWVFGNAPGSDVYAVGNAVDIGPTNEVILVGRVRSRDWDEPHYGERDVVVRVPLRNVEARDGHIEHEQNGGRWKIEYRVEHID